MTCFIYSILFCIKEVNIMSLLTSAEQDIVMYIEFENLLFDTDTFVLTKLYESFKDRYDECPYKALLDKVERNGYE